MDRLFHPGLIVLHSFRVRFFRIDVGYYHPYLRRLVAKIGEDSIKLIRTPFPRTEACPSARLDDCTSSKVGWVTNTCLESSVPSSYPSSVNTFMKIKVLFSPFQGKVCIIKCSVLVYRQQVVRLLSASGMSSIGPFLLSVLFAMLSW